MGVNDFEQETINQAVDLTAAEDQQVKDAAKRLTIVAMQKMEHYLLYGTPQFQQTLLRGFIPAMVRAANDEHTEREEIAEMRGELAKMQQAFMANLQAHTPLVEEVIDVPQDSPPSKTA